MALSLKKASANAIVVLFTPIIAKLSTAFCSIVPDKYLKSVLTKIRKVTNAKKMTNEEKKIVIITKI